MSTKTFEVTAEELLEIVNPQLHNVDEAVPVLRWDPITGTWVVVWEIPPHWVNEQAPNRETIPDDALSEVSLKRLVDRVTVDSTSGFSVINVGVQVEQLARQYAEIPDEAVEAHYDRLHGVAVDLIEIGYDRLHALGS